MSVNNNGRAGLAASAPADDVESHEDKILKAYETTEIATAALEREHARLQAHLATLQSIDAIMEGPAILAQRRAVHDKVVALERSLSDHQELLAQQAELVAGVKARRRQRMAQKTKAQLQRAAEALAPVLITVVPLVAAVDHFYRLRGGAADEPDGLGLGLNVDPDGPLARWLRTARRFGCDVPDLPRR